MKSTTQNHFARKVNTTGKHLHRPMQRRLTRAVERHQGFLVVIAKQHAERNGIPIKFVNGRPAGWLADLHAAGVYGMTRAALAWQQKEREGLRTTDFNGELRQGARVRVKHLAGKISRYQVLDQEIMENLRRQQINPIKLNRHHL